MVMTHTHTNGQGQRSLSSKVKVEIGRRWLHLPPVLTQSVNILTWLIEQYSTTACISCTSQVSQLFIISIERHMKTVSQTVVVISLIKILKWSVNLKRANTQTSDQLHSQAHPISAVLCHLLRQRLVTVTIRHTVINKGKENTLVASLLWLFKTNSYILNSMYKSVLNKYTKSI